VKSIQTQFPQESFQPSYEQWQQRNVDRHNAAQGDLKGYNCPLCKNRGDFLELVNGHEIIRFCSCKAIRQSIRNIEKSGLAEMMYKQTFDSYIANEPWQHRIKSLAEQFVSNCGNGGNASWFYIGGQVGAGKTHICTAIVGELLNQGLKARYMLWRDEAVYLKANVNDDAAYAAAIKPLKSVDVLYIDDFFKTERGNKPTTGDINLAFELINHRYNNRALTTVISSEKTVEELIDIDEAIGSRIYQRSKDFNISIGRSRDKNFRFGL